MTNICAICKKQAEHDAGQVCAHALSAANSGDDHGFFFGSAAELVRPDAWCRDCETLLLCDGFNEQWLQDANFVFLCTGCWDSVKAKLKGVPSNSI